MRFFHLFQLVNVCGWTLACKITSFGRAQSYQAEHSVFCSGHNLEGCGMVMRSFLLFQGSRPRLFSGLSAGDSSPLRILPRSIGAGELRFPPHLSHEKTTSSRQSQQKIPNAPPYIANYWHRSKVLACITPRVPIQALRSSWRFSKGDISKRTPPSFPVGK